jgi:hypothetical protein
MITDLIFSILRVSLIVLLLYIKIAMASIQCNFPRLVSNFTKYIFDITEGKETLFFLQYTLMSNRMQLWRFLSGISWVKL